MTKHLTIKDKIYGSHTITDGVFIELLQSKPVLRLKKLNQFGIPDKYYFKKNFTRYEHSVGVMLLIRRLGGTLEEQIAGLLHDASHTAFSHVVDWVIGTGAVESHQDSRHLGVINSGEVKDILEKYGYDPKIISDYHNFKLLERDIPDLCADRVDYSLREFPVTISRSLLKSIKNIDNEIVFDNKKSANIFAREFLKLQREHWGGFEAVSRYRIFSRLLKTAIEEKLIDLSDFDYDDDYVIKKLVKTKDAYVKQILKILSNRKLKVPKKGEISYKKFRYTDPNFVSNGIVRRLSEVDKAFKAHLEKERLHNKKGIVVPEIPHKTSLDT